MEKSADAFRTISEVATELNVPKHVLRFWEAKFSQLRPMKRGGGRRYYRPEDIDLLRGIRQLLYDDGYTIRGVQQILRRDGVEHVKNRGRHDSLIDDVQENAEIPDLAKEAAQEAFGSSGVMRNGERAISGKGLPTETRSLDPAHHDLLHNAVDELEKCRKRLTQTQD